MTREHYEQAYEDFTPLQRKEEFWNLLNDVIRPVNPVRILEIGTYKGGTGCLFLDFMRTLNHEEEMQYIGIDFDINPALEKFKYWFKGSLDYYLIQGDSRDNRTMDILNNTLLGPLDVLFIDGDHSFSGTMKDFRNYQHLVRQGGITACHDIEFSGVKEAINEVRRGHTFPVSEEGQFQEKPGETTYGLQWFKKG